MFNRLKQTAEQARSKLSMEASRFKNRTFMEAVVNGCVLVAAADGSIDATEKQKMAGFIERSDELKHFGGGEVIDVFQNAAALYESDNVLGKACALEIIRKIKANEDQARLLIRVVRAIGAADGDFDTQEREMVTEIAHELGLNPADFDI
jgi:tellurite resistance protein TerB